MSDETDVSRKKIAAIYVALTIATLAIYWQVHQFSFINVDDPTFVTQNVHVRSGITLEGIRWAFSTTDAGFWHPLTWLSLMLDNQLYGVKAGGYHVTNLILHLLSVLLLFWLFHRMTGAVWKSAFVAALFAVHPHHVESVAWIAERKDVLSVFFWMLTLCLYVYYTEKPSAKRYLPVIVSFSLGLMSKSMVVTLPVILILLDYWPLGRLQSAKTEGSARIMIFSQIKEKLPLFILATLLSFITLFLWNDPSGQDYSMSLRFSNASVAFVVYLGKIFRPHDMHLFHPFSLQLPAWQIVGAALLILVESVFAISTRKDLPYIFVGWFWYVITILPVIGIAQNGVFWMHEHYTYLPSIGIGTLLAWGIPNLLPDTSVHRKILFPAATTALGFLAFLSWQQCAYWKNSVTLYNQALKAAEDKVLTHNLLGKALEEQGNTVEALHHYNEAIRLKPDYAPAYYNRGSLYTKAGNYRSAIADLDKAIGLNPSDVTAYNNRGIAYAKLDQYQQALKDFDTAISLKKDYADAYNNRAYVYFNQGDRIAVCRDVKMACQSGKCEKLKDSLANGYCR